MTEAELQSRVVKALTAVGWLVTRVDPGRAKRRGGLVREGTGDLICSAWGKYCEIEIKTIGGSLRASQKRREREVIDSGSRYFVVRELCELVWVVDQMRASAGRP